MSLAAGSSFGSYTIVNHLGAGGMGEVYKATDAKFGRAVAIKVLRGNFSADPDRLRRFEQEARTAGLLNHQSSDRARRRHVRRSALSRLGIPGG